MLIFGRSVPLECRHAPRCRRCIDPGRPGCDRRSRWWRVVVVDDEYVKAERLAAELLLRARRERGLTQVDVADEMAQRGFRWTQPTVARVENGQRHISF